MNKQPEILHEGTPDAQAIVQAAPKTRAKAKSAKRTCIMVLGMHRSGTSALTRVISLLGAELPKNLISKDNNNATGYWEPAALNALDDRMLAEAGSRWDDWRAFDMTNLTKPRAQFYRAEIARILEEEYGDAPLFVLKEPRISRFVPFYADILRSVKIDVRYVLTRRNPLSVIASLGKRDGFTPGFGALLWLRHELEAERATRGKPRVFLSYEALMQEWRPKVEKMTATLAINWPRTVDDVAIQVDAYLSREHQHHTAADAQLLADERIASWVKDAHLAFTALGKNEREAEAFAVLDRVREQFDAVSPVFGEAFFPELQARQQISAQAQSDLRKIASDSAGLAEQRAAEIETLKGEARQREADWHKREARFAEEKAELHSLVGERDVEIERLIRQGGQSTAEIERLVAEALQRGTDWDEREARFAEERAELQSLGAERVAEIGQLQAQIAAKISEVAAIQEQFHSERDKLRLLAAESAGKIEELQQENAALRTRATSVETERDHARGEEKRLHGVLDAVYGSTSWQAMRPVRALKYSIAAIARAPSASRTYVSRRAYAAWHELPMPIGVKQKLKGGVFKSLPFLLKRTTAYRAWQSFNTFGSGLAVIGGNATADWDPPKGEYVPLLEAEPLANKPARVIAFYPPQFHPIPENDEWWGEGFTEWSNVKPAQPQFSGHYQPHVPGELGYYDLRDKAVQRRQIELAKLYGIEGFCFYFYWFAGKRLLEKPLENWLDDKSLDLPFCLCWANENWSRRWDGLDSEILIAQDHSPEDDLAFITEVAPFMRDPRYIRVDGRPLLLVYRPSLLPDAAETAECWRRWCRENGIGEIYLAYTQSFEKTDPGHYGFDAAIEFPPNNSAPPNVTDQVIPPHADFAATVYDWSVFPQRSEKYPPREYKLFRSVCPGWDNTARRKNSGTIFINNTPDLYRQWLESAVNDTLNNVADPDERLIFVNAWNEWAEGAHLEPDSANGYAYLQATRDALDNVTRGQRPRIIIVSHDAHPHGAQYLALNMARGYGELGFEVDVILLGEGPLLPRFATVASVHRIDLAAEPEAAVLQRLEALRQGGATVAIANTTVSGLLVPLLKKAGFHTVSLIHELPGVLNSCKLEEHARAIADNADRVLFAAQLVRKGFEDFVGCPLEQALIRPQGVLRKSPFKGLPKEARRFVGEAHGLSTDTRIVLSVAFVDHRKGPDIFIEMAEKVLQTHPDTAFIWIGHFDAGMEETIYSLLSQKDLTDRVKFVGFIAEPMAYYAAASVYALTSREDPFPNVVLESAEVGVPAVAFEGATGAADFIVEHGGRLANGLDVDDFAAKVRELLDAPSVGARRPVGSLRQYLMDIMHHATGFQRVSVVVPNYNYAHHLPQRLQSIGEQTYPIYELIVLDDASTDESVVVVERFLREREDLDSELVVNEKNSGSVFRQWKKGVARCRGDLVWIAEADDFAENGLLEELAPSFADPSLALAYSQSRQVDGDGRVLAGDYLDYTRDISKDWLSDYIKDGETEIGEAMAVKNTIPNVSAVVFRRTAIKTAIADLGEELYETRIAGDWLIYLRTLLHGKIRFSAKPLNSHRRHAESVTKSAMAERHLAEVKRAQEIARSLAPVSAETQGKAEAWLAHVRSYLGIRRGSDAA